MSEKRRRRKSSKTPKTPENKTSLSLSHSPEGTSDSEMETESVKERALVRAKERALASRSLRRSGELSSSAVAAVWSEAPSSLEEARS